MSRFAPRHVFALCGLLLVALAAWSDRYEFELFFAGVGDSGLGQEPDVLALGAQRAEEEDARLQLSPEVAASERLRRGIQGLVDAKEAVGAALQQALSQDPALGLEGQGEGFPWDAALQALDTHGWATYDAARAQALPAYRRAVETFAREARAAGAADPHNGVYALAAALAELDLCYRPSPLDPLFGWDEDGDASAARLRVVDPEGLERSLTGIEQALGAEQLTFHTNALLRARAAAYDAPGPVGQLARLSGMATIEMPELMFLKQRMGLGLSQLARRARLQGRPGERFLRLSRLAALREGAEGEGVITVLVGLANAQQADEAWLLDAVARGDTTRALAANQELGRLQRARTESLNPDLPRERLGLVDWFLLPAGGWSRDWSPELSMATDYAYMESAALWLLTLLCLGLLAHCAWLSRRTAEGAAGIAPWTLGDLLAVVVPSLGGATALTLCYYRLHPATQLGLGVGALESRLFPLVFLPSAGAFSCVWSLRRAVLAKAGLGFARPRAARASLLLTLLAAGLAISWIGPWSTALIPLTLALALSALVLAWRGGVLGRGGLPPASRDALARYQGRVGLACLGAGLLLVGAVQLGAVSWRRERLTRELADQHVRLFLEEARVWGDGKIQDAMRAVLEESPRLPRTRLELAHERGD